jgi:hypothetical protein
MSFQDLTPTHWIQLEDYRLVKQTSLSRQYGFGLVHAFYATMGGFVFDTTEPPIDACNTYDVPSFASFVYIMKYFPHIIPDISETYITDRAESSSLSKALLIVQVAWFCTNCASRSIQQLPLSLVEVSTSAHAFCTLATYFVWWSKPLNIAEGTPMRGEDAREVYALLKCTSREYSEALRMAREIAARGAAANSNAKKRVALAANALLHLLPDEEEPPSSRFRDPHWASVPGSLSSKSSHWTELLPTVIPPMLYGFVHILAWNGRFPTPLERLLWRVSSVVVTCSGFTLASTATVANLGGLIGGFWKALLDTTFMIFVAFVPLVHTLASGFLLVESFRQLLFLDTAVYQLTSWSNYWPHFS